MKWLLSTLGTIGLAATTGVCSSFAVACTTEIKYTDIGVALRDINGCDKDKNHFIRTDSILAELKLDLSATPNVTFAFFDDEKNMKQYAEAVNNNKAVKLVDYVDTEVHSITIAGTYYYTIYSTNAVSNKNEHRMKLLAAGSLLVAAESSAYRKYWALASGNL